MKVCQVIFSTNRVEYLKRTLQHLKNLNWDGCTVDRIFIDDYPQGRDDLFLSELVKAHGFTEIYLHKENKGLSSTWTEFWDIVRKRNYDYVWHQEDDVLILYPIKIMDLIILLQKDPELSQVVLKRQKWYSNEEETRALDTDWTYLNYRYEKHSVIFSPMASLYSTERVHFPYSDWYKQSYPQENWSQINYNEGMVGKALREGLGLVSGHLKASQGQNLVEHIGDFFVGRRVLENEPGFSEFSRYDPSKKYDSKTGEIWDS